MRFVIHKIERQGDMTLVTGKTSVGMIKGIWNYAELPVIDVHYHIELSIDNPCEINISQKFQYVPCVDIEKDKVIFNGICEGIDEEVYYLRFDVDWLEMLDINTIAAKKQIGDHIAFSASVYDVRIYPYTL